MAKALLGHLGQGSDLRLVAEARRLRDRVRSLEIEVAELRAANSELESRALSAELHMDQRLLTLSVSDDISEREPALT